MQTVKNLTQATKLKFISLLLFTIAFQAPAQAALVTFDFNALKDGDSNGKVDTYMQGVLNANGLAGDGNSVAVTGAKAEQNYTGDDYVVGPQTTSYIQQRVRQNGQWVWVTVPVTQTTSLTLGNSEHATFGGAPWTPGGQDTFLVNSGSDRITMTFDFAIYGVQFDFEIFPNAQCADGSKTSCILPDFTFLADGILQFHTDGIMPGAGGTYAHSPHSNTGIEKAPQYLGVSGWWLFPEGVTKLEFVDWPVMIGIDNLVIDTTPPREDVPPPTVPEPGTLALLAVGLAGLRRFRKPTSSSAGKRSA